jgi:hypothetical protein
VHTGVGHGTADCRRVAVAERNQRRFPRETEMRWPTLEEILACPTDLKAIEGGRGDWARTSGLSVPKAEGSFPK